MADLHCIPGNAVHWRSHTVDKTDSAGTDRFLETSVGQHLLSVGRGKVGLRVGIVDLLEHLFGSSTVGAPVVVEGSAVAVVVAAAAVAEEAVVVVVFEVIAVAGVRVVGAADA